MNWIIFFLIFVIFVTLPSLIMAIKNKGQGVRTSSFSRDNTTIYKGFAILCIICSHYMNIMGGGVTLFTPLGGTGVSIFLFLSGYGLNESWNSSIQKNKIPYKDWWKKRLINVAVPYGIVSLVLYWIPHFMSHGFQSHDLLDIILDLCCLKPQYIYGWYLQYLALWYFIFYFVKRTPFFNKNRYILFSLISIAIFIFTRGLVAEQSLSFVFGIILSDFKYKAIIENLRSCKSALVILIVGITFLAIKQTDLIRSAPKTIFNLVQLFIKLPIGFGSVMMIYQLSKKINLDFIKVVGVISYEYYIIHGYILGYFCSRNSEKIYGAVMFFVVSFTISFLYRFFIKNFTNRIKNVLKT